MTARYVAAVDQGTTSTRCVLFDHDGRMVSIAQQQHRQYFPSPGWVEQDAAEIWAITRRVIPQALKNAGVGPADVAGIGITNQRETVLLWDRATGVPVHRAIGWQDTRTGPVLAEVAQRLPAAEILRRSGLPMVNYFSAAKVRWLLQSQPDLQERAARGELLLGTMDTWLTWNLTGGVRGGRHVTDVTNASRTMLMNLESLDWDPALLNAFDIPRVILPEITSSTGDFGKTVEPIPGVPVAALLGDQQASLFGQGAVGPAEAKCTFGTGAFLLLNTGTELVRSSHGLITTVARQIGDEAPMYALEGSMAMAGGLVTWCRDNLQLIRTPAEIETLAATVPDNGGCYVVPAFSGLFAPYWNGDAQGIIVGLTSFVTRAHIARAVLEATAWQTRDVVDAMNADVGASATRLLVDGGMTADNLLMQMVADVLDMTVVRPTMAESVSLGAAYAAGLAVGYWPDQSALHRHWQRAGEWNPAMDPARRAAELGQWRNAVALAQSWRH